VLLEGANNHFGKVLLTYATYIDKEKFEAHKDGKKLCEVLEGLSNIFS
jgi:hypothetical protein